MLTSVVLVKLVSNKLQIFFSVLVKVGKKLDDGVDLDEPVYG